MLQPRGEAMCKVVAINAPGEHCGLVSDQKGARVKWQWQESRAPNDIELLCHRKTFLWAAPGFLADC